MPQTQSTSEKFINTDENFTLAEPSYEKLGFKPEGGGQSSLAMTSARVLSLAEDHLYQPFNLYKRDSGKPTVTAYLTDWAQYDGRLDTPPSQLDPSNYGRGYDLQKLIENANALDRVVFAFLGIVGDDGEKSALIEKMAKPANDGTQPDGGFNTGQFDDGYITILDWWGDLAAWRNCGFTEADGSRWEMSDSNWKRYYWDETGKTRGLLGGLTRLKAANSNLKLAFSIGGWTLSRGFSPMANDEGKRNTFCNSIVEFFNRFPMFDAVDLDWEYPGYDCYPGSGEATPEFDKDAENYKTLIQELRAALDKKFPTKKEITIATSAVIEKLERTKIKDVFDAGVDNLYVMTYDFFGTGWSDKLGHHTNLLPYGGKPDDSLSVKKAIDYLIEQGIPSKKIHVGYATYGRAAAEANIKTGEYNKTSKKALGSFELGAVELPDSLYNFLDLEITTTPEGKNGFKYYTDPTAKACFLYREETGDFITLDTPYSVYQKGQYVLQQGLGGLFSWDIDNGILMNSAREGLGYEKLDGEQKIDMTPLYKPGESFELP